MLVRRPLRLRYSLYHSLVASVVVAWVRAVWASRCSCCSCCSMSFCTILFIMIRAFLAACGGERKKEICGSPLLHPPDARAPHPGKGLRPLHSKLGISATQLLILPAPSTAEEIKQVV